MKSAELEGEGDRFGFARLLHDLRKRRRRFRQFAGVAFVFLVTLRGEPSLALWAGGSALVCLGMATRLWASGFVMKNEVLATSGPYGRVRHPLYVGNIVICIGFCLASGLWWSYAAAVLVLLVFYPPAIEYEDRKLRRLFPGEWDQWAAQTRALLPSLRPYAGTATDDEQRWSLKLSLHRNGEPIHIAVLLACLGYLYWLLP